MKELQIEQMEIILDMMKSAAAEHPKANITYSPEHDCVSVTYPLPKDFWNIEKIEIRER